MSEPINDGGPAFPSTGVNFDEHYNVLREEVYHAGLSMRDYFAAKAMELMVLTSNGIFTSDCARRCYEAADAMLKARHQ